MNVRTKTFGSASGQLSITTRPTAQQLWEKSWTPPPVAAGQVHGAARGVRCGSHKLDRFDRHDRGLNWSTATRCRQRHGGAAKCSACTAYAYLKHAPADFSVAHAHRSHILSLPIYPEISDEMISRAAARISGFFG